MFDNLSTVLNEIAFGKILTCEESFALFTSILSGRVSEIQIAALLMALRMRYWQIEEVEGAVLAMRNMMIPIQSQSDHTIDVCGTGGDGHSTLNISTAVSFVLAALGVPVAKHGNRAQSSKTGGIDVLTALGIPPETDVKILQKNLETQNLAFLPAFIHHPALQTVNNVRKQLGFRTIFNILGPLANPACVKRQLIGVFDDHWLEPMVTVLSHLGSKRVWAINGKIEGETDQQGVDEITLAGPTTIIALENNQILKLNLSMQQIETAGFKSYPLSAIAGGDSENNAKALLALLNGQHGAYRDTVLLNSAVALHISGYGQLLNDRLQIDPLKLRDLSARAAEVLDNGAAMAALQNARKLAVSTDYIR